ncbi:MAG: hypothetical protein TQ37_07665 [Candidatus Synechococcus spongiarum 15L]|uniref:Uncharacterized protein n=1 Tax=Candidatus Synechococcus spongiarum 15L TaxID=1608419 RepID=A0A0G8AT47_9SYNE|nr:MAG: hypothetical protein TQ37_07665 [Candidatus Synechococcus spongiarum 15L]
MVQSLIKILGKSFSQDIFLKELQEVIIKTSLIKVLVVTLLVVVHAAKLTMDLSGDRKAVVSLHCFNFLLYIPSAQV